MHAIAHLVVVLGEDDKSLAGDGPAGAAVSPFAVLGILAVVYKPIPQGFEQVIEAAEVAVVALMLTREDGVQAVVQVIVPLGVQPEAAQVRRADQPRVVQGAFGDQMDVPPQAFGKVFDRIGQLLQKRPGRKIQNGVDRIEPQGIDVAGDCPVQRVFDEIPAHFVAVIAVEIDGCAPRSLVEVRKIWAEIPKVVAFRAEVVVDDIQHHCQAPGVAGVDESFESHRSAVRVLGGKRIDPVIAPVAFAGELGHGHELNGGNAESRQVVQPLNGRIESACRGERADVQFIDDIAVQGKAAPVAVCPFKGRIHDQRRTVNAPGLAA